MRILVVEDEKRIADFLGRGLESGGYAVTLPTTAHPHRLDPLRRLRPGYLDSACRYRRIESSGESPEPQTTAGLILSAALRGDRVKV